MLSPIAVFAKSCAVLGSPLASQSHPGGSGVRLDGLLGAAGAAGAALSSHTHHLQIFLSYLLLLFVCGPTLFFSLSGSFSGCMHQLRNPASFQI
jgi:hypothetical protein